MHLGGKAVTFSLEYLKKLLADYEAQKTYNLTIFHNRNEAIARANDVFLLRVDKLPLIRQLVELMEEQKRVEQSPHSPE